MHKKVSIMVVRCELKIPPLGITVWHHITNSYILTLWCGFYVFCVSSGLSSLFTFPHFEVFRFSCQERAEYSLIFCSVL